MKKQNKKTIFLFFIMLMLLLGICTENVQTDSSLMYGIIHNTDNVLTASSDNVITEAAFSESKTGTLSTGSFFRQESSRINSRLVRDRSIFFLLAELLLSAIPVFFTCFLLRQSHLVLCRDVIVEYLHRKDGKKNRYFLL